MTAEREVSEQMSEWTEEVWIRLNNLEIHIEISNWHSVLHTYTYNLIYYYIIIESSALPNKKRYCLRFSEAFAEELYTLRKPTEQLTLVLCAFELVQTLWDFIDFFEVLMSLSPRCQSEIVCESRLLPRSQYECLWIVWLS